MNIFREGFRHFLTTNISDGVKREAVEYFVVIIEVLSDGVHNQTEEVRVLVHEQRHGQVTLQAY